MFSQAVLQLRGSNTATVKAVPTPPGCHVETPQEIAGLIKGLLTIGFPINLALFGPFFLGGGYVFQGNPSPQKWAISNPSKTIGNFKSFLVHLLGSYSRDSGGVFRIMYQEFFEGPNWSHSKKGAEGF